MKITNRGYILVQPKQPFLDWANQFEDDIVLTDADDLEPNIYLVEDDFIETEPVIKSYYKKIFINELSSVSDLEEDFPEISDSNFEEWFTIIIGSTVFDTQKTNFQSFSVED